MLVPQRIPWIPLEYHYYCCCYYFSTAGFGVDVLRHHTDPRRVDERGGGNREVLQR